MVEYLRPGMWSYSDNGVLLWTTDPLMQDQVGKRKPGWPGAPKENDVTMESLDGALSAREAALPDQLAALLKTVPSDDLLLMARRHLAVWAEALGEAMDARVWEGGMVDDRELKLLLQYPDGRKTRGSFKVPFEPEQLRPKEDPAPAIKGYRALSTEEIALVNGGKDLGLLIKAFCDRVKALPDSDKRWAAEGTTDLQKGMMSLTRAITRPDNF